MVDRIEFRERSGHLDVRVVQGPGGPPGPPGPPGGAGVARFEHPVPVAVTEVALIEHHTTRDPIAAYMLNSANGTSFEIAHTVIESGVSCEVGWGFPFAGTVVLIF